MDVESIYQALFALTAGLTWPGGGALAFTSRRVKTFEELPAQPALCQAETDETVAQVTSQQSITTLGATWLIYHQAGKDDDAIPAQTTNAILSAVKALFVDPTDPAFAQTLGGAVHKCWIDGRIQKFQGDLDGQTLIVVPIKILVPYFSSTADPGLVPGEAGEVALDAQRRVTEGAKAAARYRFEEFMPDISDEPPSASDSRAETIAALIRNGLSNGPIAQSLAAWDHLQTRLGDIARAILEEI